MSPVDTAPGGETNGVHGSELSWFYPKNGGNQEGNVNTKQEPNSLPVPDLQSLEVLWRGSVTAAPPSLAPLKHVTWPAEPRKHHESRLHLKDSVCPGSALNPAFADPSLVGPENCYLKVLFWRQFWAVWNTGKVSGIRRKGRPDAKKHEECYGDIMAFCDIPVLSRNPKMSCYRTRLGTASKDLKSSEAAEVHQDITSPMKVRSWLMWN